MGKEDIAGSEHRTEPDPAFRRDLAKEFFRPLHQDAATIATQAVGADSTAVCHAFERSQRGINQTARGRIVQACDQAETAGIVFESCVV